MNTGICGATKPAQGSGGRETAAVGTESRLPQGASGVLVGAQGADVFGVGYLLVRWVGLAARYVWLTWRAFFVPPRSSSSYAFQLTDRLNAARRFTRKICIRKRNGEEARYGLAG